MPPNTDGKNFEEAINSKTDHNKLGVADAAAKFIQDEVADYMKGPNKVSAKEALKLAENDLKTLTDTEVKAGHLPPLDIVFSQGGTSVTFKTNDKNIDVQMDLDPKSGRLIDAADAKNNAVEFADGSRFTSLQDIRDDVTKIVTDVLPGSKAPGDFKADMDTYLHDWARRQGFNSPMTSAQEADALEYLAKAALPQLDEKVNHLGNGTYIFNPAGPDKLVDRLAKTFQHNLVVEEEQYVKQQAKDDPKYLGNVLSRLQAFDNWIEKVEEVP